MKIYNSSGAILLEINDAAGTMRDGQFVIEDLDLKSQNLNEAAFENIAFTLGDMDGMQLLGCNFNNVYFEGVWLCETDLSGSVIQNTEFYGVQAYGAKFSNAHLHGVKFYGTNLSKTDFSNAQLSQVVFGRDNIHHKTAIMGANFLGTNLGEATFQGVIYDELTRFPEGFNPTAHDGLVREST